MERKQINTLWASIIVRQIVYIQGKTDKHTQHVKEIKELLQGMLLTPNIEYTDTKTTLQKVSLTTKHIMNSKQSYTYTPKGILMPWGLVRR